MNARICVPSDSSIHCTVLSPVAPPTPRAMGENDAEEIKAMRVMAQKHGYVLTKEPETMEEAMALGMTKDEASADSGFMARKETGIAQKPPPVDLPKAAMPAPLVARRWDNPPAKNTLHLAC